MPQLQTIIVVLIVAGAAFYLMRRVLISLKKDNSTGCNCGCSGCSTSKDCEDFQSKYC